MTEEEIKDICWKYSIHDYKINPDMSIDVNGNVRIATNVDDGVLPLNFNKIHGHFYCHGIKLTSLKGCPKYVKSSFICSDNYLTTLEYCPNYVGYNFFCIGNNLTTLQHLPVNFFVSGYFICEDNNITETKEFSKLLFGHIGGEIQTDHKKLNEFLNENKNPPKKDLPRLLSELRKIQL